MDQTKVWDFHQNEGVSSFAGSRRRLSWLAERFTSEERVLNIGVGAGYFEDAAIARGIDVYVLDPGERAVTTVRSRLNLGEKAVVGFSQGMPFPSRYFDGVVMSEVLEHLDDDVFAMTLKEVRRLLRPGGKFVGTVPARENLENERTVCPDCGKVFHRWGHLQSFTRDSLRDRLSAEFMDVRVEARLFPSWELLNWKGKLGAVAKAVLLSLGVHGSNELFYFQARPR